MRIYYRLKNKLSGVSTEVNLRNVSLFLVLFVIMIFIGTKASLSVEKRLWDNRVAEIYPELTFATYLPNFTNIFVSPWKMFFQSDLPTYQLDIKPKDLRKIIDNAPGYLESLPADKLYVPAKFYADGKEYDVEVRLRGTISDHWFYNKKSWRMNILKGEKFNGLSSINFILPERKKFLVEQYSNFVADKLGLITNDTRFVRLRINNSSFAVYWMTQQWGEDFLEVNNLPSNTNFYSEDDQIDHLFSKAEYWKKYTFNKDRDKDDFSDLEELLDCLNFCDNEEFYHSVPDIIDMDNFYRWQAHTVILGDDHQDGSHNMLLYFNPEVEKFQFIPWDVNRFKFNGVADILYNPIVGRILANPEFMHERNKVLWDYVGDDSNKDEDMEYYDQLYSDVQGAFYADHEKRYSNQFFDYHVLDRRGKAMGQYDYLKNLLSNQGPALVEVSKSDFGINFSVVVNSFSGLRLEDVTLHGQFSDVQIYYDSNNNARFDREDELLSDFQYNQKNNETKAANFNKDIFAKRELPQDPHNEVEGSFLPSGYERLIETVPVKHTFFVVGLDDLSVLDLKINNAVTNKEVEQEIKFLDNVSYKEDLRSVIF